MMNSTTSLNNYVPVNEPLLSIAIFLIPFVLMCMISFAFHIWTLYIIDSISAKIIKHLEEKESEV